MTTISDDTKMTAVVAGACPARNREAAPLWRPEQAAADKDASQPHRAVVAHVLPLFSDALSDAFVLDALSARRIGWNWGESRCSLERLLETVRNLTADLVDEALNRHDVFDTGARCLAAQRISELGSRILIELTRGFQQAVETPHAHEEPTRRRHAELLLTGAMSPPPGLCYAVVGLSGSDLDPAVVDGAFRTHGGQQTMSMLTGSGGHVLLPALSKADAVQLVERTLKVLDGAIRAAVVWSEERSLSACRSAADDILEQAIALELTPGVHVLADVLLAFAAAHEPTVSNALLKVIQPLLAQPMLWETLQVLLAEDGNRGRVAERLIIHRSTVDYRLHRIDQLTGHSPCTIRGLRLLATASAMHRLAELRGNAS